MATCLPKDGLPNHIHPMSIRWGIIGCGDVCEVKSGPGFQKATASELVAVMRRDGDLAQDYARRHGVPRWYDTADALIADAEVDAVYVATPPGSHLEIALKIAAAGKPAYVEKPMARSATECREMIAAFERAEPPLFVAYYRRCLPRFIKVKELLPQIGELRSVSYHCTQTMTDVSDARPLPWRLQPEHSGGGLFLDLGCHALDIIDFILGPLKNTSGRASNSSRQYEAEDRVDLQWQHDPGIAGQATFDFNADSKIDRLEITGSHGTIATPCFDLTPIELTINDQRQDIDVPTPEHVHQPMIQSIVDELNGNGRCPSTGASALRTSAVIDAVLNDYYGGRADAFWERSDTWPGNPLKGMAKSGE